MIRFILGTLLNCMFHVQKRPPGVRMHLSNQGGWGYIAVAAATYFGSQSQSDAAGDAAHAQTQGQQASINEMQHEFDTIMGNQAPYRKAGYSALNALLNMDGLPSVSTNTDAGGRGYGGYNSLNGGGTASPAGNNHLGVNSSNNGAGINIGNGKTVWDSTPGVWVPDSTSPSGHRWIPTGDSHEAQSENAIPTGNGLVDSTVYQSTTMAGKAQRRFGGPVRGGTSYVVGEPDPKTGEARPEVLHLAPGSRGYVVPNPKTFDGAYPHRALGGPVGEPDYSGFGKGLGGVNALNPAPKGPQPLAVTQPGGSGVMHPVDNDPTANDGTKKPVDPGFDPFPTPAGGTGQTFYDKNGNPISVTPGSNGSSPTGGYDFRTDPGYNFAFDEGMRALEGGNAANGLLHSTANTREAVRYGQGMADQEYNDIYNRILAISGLGASANNSANSLGAQLSGNIANAYGNIGNAQAGGYINAGNANANMLNSLGNLYFMYNNGSKGPGG
jgi:hypothetical protein